MQYCPLTRNFLPLTIFVALLALTGCSKSGGENTGTSSGGGTPATLTHPTIPNNPQAQQLATQHAQGAEADAKKAAAAMSKGTTSH